MHNKYNNVSPTLHTNIESNIGIDGASSCKSKKSGIRQECQVAPYPFLLVMSTPVHEIKADKQTNGNLSNRRIRGIVFEADGKHYLSCSSWRVSGGAGSAGAAQAASSADAPRTSKRRAGGGGSCTAGALKSSQTFSLFSPDDFVISSFDHMYDHTIISYDLPLPFWLKVWVGGCSSLTPRCVLSINTRVRGDVFFVSCTRGQLAGCEATATEP